MRAKFILLSLLVTSTFCTANADAWTFTDIDGKDYQPFSDSSTKALVLIFITTDCPVANFYQPVIKKLAASYATRGIPIYLVHPDTTVTARAADNHRKEYGITCPVVLDHEHAWVEKTKATITPEAVLINRDKNIVYQGRIDNRYAKLGHKRQVVTSFDLKEALDAVLNHTKIKQAKTPAIGCLIADMK